MAWFVAVLPIRPGKEDRARSYEAELEKHKAAYEELNKRAGVKRHMEFLQDPIGPLPGLVIETIEFDDRRKLGRAFTDSAYDAWWIERIADLHGVDLKDPMTFPKVEQILDWKA